MDFDEALQHIRSFWQDEELPFGGGGGKRDLARLQDEFQQAFPDQLRKYVGSFLPSTRFVFEAVGNPVELYGHSEISARAKGYNFNPVTNEPIEGWSYNWVLIGDEGADPIIVDLVPTITRRFDCEVSQAMHGMEEWSFSPVADSLPQYVLLLAARHHAMTGFGPQDPIDDDDGGFNLADEPADWYFPFVDRYAARHYDEWAGVFDNS